MKPGFIERITILFLILSPVASFHSYSYSQTPEVRIVTSDIWSPGLWSKVDLVISGGSNLGPCRIVQNFPVDFTVRPLDSPGCDMYFSNNSLNIVWTRLPAVKSFTVSYEVMPEQSISGMIVLGGDFYFVTAANIRSVVRVPQKTIRIDNSGSGRAGVDTEPASAISETKPNPGLIKIPPLVVTKPAYKDGEVEFRIQVLTSSSMMTDQELMKRLDVDFMEKVSLVSAGEVIKYQVGSFPTFESAGVLLKKFKSEGVTEAFIVAFYKGEQITIDKARSISK